MTSLQVRTEPNQQDDGAEILLDWFGASATSTVRCDPTFLKGLAPSPVARDLLTVGGAVYCTDKTIRRAAAPDRWTRRLDLQVPVSDADLWNGAKPDLIKALSFLSGDRWSLTFVPDTAERPDPVQTDDDVRIVSLFSGGLDSLAGVIDLLDAGRRVALVGHHDSARTDSTQVALFNALGAAYGSENLCHRRLFLRPNQTDTGQVRPLPRGGENTTRSRSFLFLAAATAVANAYGDATPLYMPENGFIGINVPLTPARSGSLSTRTTHPLFTDLMRRVLAQLGLTHPIENPYRLKTKGELLEECVNRSLLLKLAPETISCSHPEASRWVNRPQGNCGYCYPCLIRRSALHRLAADQDPQAYAWDALADSSLLRRSSTRGRSLRALASSLGRAEHPDDVLMNGRIPNGETTAFFNVYRRGRAEIRDWLNGAGPELQRRL